MQLNHVLVRTTDLDAMTHFWRELIGLEVGARPPFQSRGAWLYSDGEPLIHLIEVPAIGGDGCVDHMALEGGDYETLRARLEAGRADFRETSVPESGDRQLFVRGPDGLRVELLFRNGEERPK
ncbi:VOC family protein [Microbulbifer sp. SAOS-129_SWC]|uniref:VOC family protein n=1 Tax=Microbulbifer sp. SAOS-129_SWC TaxID=3145235 RepID=UPI003216BF89